MGGFPGIISMVYSQSDILQHEAGWCLRRCAMGPARDMLLLTRLVSSYT